MAVESPDVEFEIAVIETGPDTITLEKSRGIVSEPGLKGIRWRFGDQEGAGVLGDIIDEDAQSVTRLLSEVTGDAPPTEGSQPVLADIDNVVHQGDPQSALDLDYEEVTFDSPVGPLAAWHVPATESTTWIIMVHGRGPDLRSRSLASFTFGKTSSTTRATCGLWRRSDRGGDRQFFLKDLTTFAELGLNSLVITYRNDPSQPKDPSGYHQAGRTEWEDLAGAVEFAQAHGAQEIVLYGSSMGGSIVASYLRQTNADNLAAVVLDSPMLNIEAAVDQGAENVGLPLPPTLPPIAKWLASVRFDIDWTELDYLTPAEHWSVPTLIFHGVNDTTVPHEPSRMLASSRPEYVTYIETSANHVTSWHVDPVEFEAQLTAFLEEVLG